MKCIINTDDFKFTPKTIVVMGIAGCVSKSIDDLEELTTDYINEHYGDLQDDAYDKGYAQCQDDYSDALKHAKDTAYQRGFEDGKAQAELGCEGCKYEGISQALEPCHRCARNSTDHWTAKQTDDKIEVGDEVVMNGEDAKTDGTGVITWIGEKSGLCNVMWSDGSIGEWAMDELTKTDRHFDISSILKEMQS